MSELKQLLINGPGKKLFLLGNEAIARGAIEAGVRVATTYPGTPSSEVGNVLSELAKQAGIYFQFSVNEKVAIEVAYSSAISGLRSFVFMKHVGLNVAADPLMSISYTGVRAGLVVMSADDPSMFSSQNEQDNRNYSELAHIPLIEPSTSQEAKDFLKYAFEISEMEHIPVLFRTTTRVSHQRGMVELGEIAKKEEEGFFKSDPKNFVALPVNSMGLKEALIKKMERLKTVSDNSRINRIESYGSGKYGIITSGEAYNVLMDTVSKYGLDVSILKLGFTNPLPENMVTTFLKEHENVIVVEELDPFLETKVRIIAQMHLTGTKIFGKIDGYFTFSHEYNPDTVAGSLSRIMGFNVEQVTVEIDASKLPPRPPVLCPGCPHRATYYAVKRAVKMSNIKDPIYSSDIGCYSLGVYDPYDEADVMIDMGSSIGVGGGFSNATGQKVISFIGDSTFFHSGIPGLINAVHNEANVVLIVLDNRTTAMTGQQPNPGMNINGMGDAAPEVSIEAIVKAIGIQYVKVVDPYDLKSTLLAVSGALRNEGVSVIVARRECAMIRDERMRSKKEWKTYQVDPEKCKLCMNCVEKFSCPAIFIEGGKIRIDQNICDGCGVCAEPYVCPPKAIEEVQTA
ncbi:MAG: indolepyruvate ferredoxin oxidoreductase subunit alpha [Thermoplasmatales archaeon B_DKE]|nr:MAG: indolepyruvate ferredoxin oxidoreductase subunit alpha [Thermoplasmatales archaeon B_DKE]